MNYDIHITLSAERDLNRAADYIEFTLKNPQAADHLLDEADRQINALSQFPKQHPLVPDDVLSSWGIRFTQAGNYLAFYIVSDEERIVRVIRFLYAKCDWNSILKLGYSLI